ncbi:tetratricopeptide repeat protein [Streptomyces sp. 8K308]|uniref:AfsR/SARP family transcriptional regulator n=1 Tax=Streptomyces sp. 8K308 TaxID=2530388 RepID=UPI00105338EB|nr:BTAD domain-containing putative transcriptional regulator [Streptomyces sp. 8K308]TDC12563.1 tetratricopeptide repeat protein [Streptomyces sp. 8K308]
MRFQVLGELAIRRDGRQEALGGRLERSLLAVLLARAGRPVPTDVLIDALWGDQPDPRGGQRLQLQVHRLRRKLGEPDRLALGPAGYRLRVEPGELDAERFESAVEEGLAIAAREDPRGAVESLRGALGLWRGAPFTGVDLPLLDDWVHRLVERRLVALETLYESELTLGRHAEIVAELLTQVREHPMRERFHALLMTALARAGRQADALAAYRAVRETLMRELGVEPGPELRELERRVLAGEALGPGGHGEHEARRLAAPAGRGEVPAQLPLDVRNFVGRDAELAELDGLLATASAAVAAVSGTAGVGKTALVVHWGHRGRERFPDGQLYVDLHGYGPDQPVAPQDALAGFLRALGQEGTALPQGLAERAARFRTLVAGRRMLIVLDNAHAVEQVRPLLPGAPSCFTLVTSRDTLAGLVVRDGAHRVRVARLPATDAHHLLRELLGPRVEAEPEAAEALVEQCVRLPLALRIVAELIRSRPALSLTELAGELAERQGALDLLHIEGDPHTAVRSVFSWSYQRLDPAAARVFRLLGLHPGHDTDTHAVAALAGHTLRETRRCLDTLLRAHLVDQTGDGRHRQHDLLRDYAAELAESTDTAAERASALGRLRDHYLYAASAAMDVFAPNDYAHRPKVSPPDGPSPSFPGHDQARRWLDAERANLLEVTRHGDPAFVTRLSETVHLYLRVGGYFDEAVALHGRALRAARAAGDEFAEANARRVLGTMMNLWGDDPEEVVGHFRQALAVYERAGDRSLQASVLNGLAGVALRRGELPDALRQYELALELNGTEGNWRVRCALLVNMGRTLRTLGRLDEARRRLESVLELCESHGDKSVEANTHCVLADVHTRLGDEATAFEHAHRSMALARETGYRQIEALCLNKLGTLHRNRGELAEALRLHGEALALARAVGESELTVEMLNTLAATHTAAGDPARALPLHEEALALAVEVGERVARAHSHAAIGDTRARLGEHAAAREHWRQALADYEAGALPQAVELRARLEADAP